MNNTLKVALSGDLNEYRPIPFWSWNNNLDENELIKQIEEMRFAGLGGFIIHARKGMKEEYLGEKWFSCIEACLKKARELDMQAWIYDENGWPSGFVGGKLLETETFRARYLEYSVGQYDPAAFVSYIADEENGFFRVNGEMDGVHDYHNVYLRVSVSNTDILNPEVVDAFICETHEKYFERFSESFGRELVGFFTDEPQFFRWATPYTHCVEEIFEQDGEDVKDGLIWLFQKDNRGYSFREKYYGALNRLYCENYYQKLSNWCHVHGCKLTGHSIEEGALYTQMWGGAAVMPSYECEDIPAIDWLGRYCGSELAPKQVGSVADQLGKKRVLTETFGCAGFDVTPKELKSVAEFQYFNGVNMMCQHLYPYSMAGVGKTDHPPVFSTHSGWFKEFSVFNDYFARLGYIVSETQENCDIAIIHPIREIWLDYVRSEDFESVKEIEKSFSDLIVFLRKNGITYQFIDEYILEKYGKVSGNTLVVGKRTYSTVLVPKMRTLASATYRILKKYQGKLCLLGALMYLDGKLEKIDLASNISIEEIIKNAAISYACEDGRSFFTSRSGRSGGFLFVKNLSMTEESHVHFEGVAEHWRALDLETLTERMISNDITLGAGESLILIRGENVLREMSRKEENVTSQFTTTAITENYLVLDYGCMKRQNGEFGTERNVSGLFEELLREDYKGEITVRQKFTLNEKMPVTLVMEKANLKSAAVNGKAVTFAKSAFDINFCEAEIGGAVKEGVNEFCYTFDFFQHDGVHFALFNPEATENLKNCLYYDTSIEPVYLKGNFIVVKDRSLSMRHILPPVTAELYKEGYPHFYGSVTLEGNYDWVGAGRVFIRIDGRFLVAQVTVNGKRTELILDNQKEITPFLKKGNNRVSILLKASLRNIFGPLHFRPIAEPMAVNPYHFEFRGAWETGDPSAYTENYQSVPFGADKILFITEEEKVFVGRDLDNNGV